MIKKISMQEKYGNTFTLAQLVRELAIKQDEIIDKVNELDIKLQTVKYFTPESEKAVKELVELLGDDK